MTAELAATQNTPTGAAAGAADSAGAPPESPPRRERTVSLLTLRWAFLALLTLVAFNQTFLSVADSIRVGSLNGFLALMPIATLIASVGVARRERVELPIHDRQTDIIVGLLGLTAARQEFTFEGIDPAPGPDGRCFVVPSVLRDFSAPVILEHDPGDDALAFLLAHDTDAFNRWEASQRLATHQQLVVLHKPFDAHQALRLAQSLIARWHEKQAGPT